jgi:enterochelin esterase-like enzyme
MAQPLISPQLSADRTVTFRLKAPNAKKVELQMETAPKQLMAKDENGIWSLTTAPLAPNIYGYSFLVDGTNISDPNNGQVVPNAIYPASALLVPGEKPMPWEQTDVPHGLVHMHTYESKVVGDKRDFYVYTPPNFQPKKRYPMLVLLHGYSDYADAWTRVGKANLIMDNLTAEGKVKPMIVVMPLGYGVPMDKIMHQVDRDPSVWQRNVAGFQEALLQEVLPMVEKAYKVEMKREKRAIAGLSMGGGESLQTGLNRMDQFAYVGAFSSGGWGAEPETLFPTLSSKDNAQRRLLWIACGKNDSLIKENRQFVAWLDSKQIEHKWFETEGEHTWVVWRRYLADFTQQLNW